MRTLLRRLRAALPIRPGEAGRIALCFAHFFALLCAYYVLRPVRDEIGVREGVSRLPWLFTGTLVATVAIVPVFGFLASRYPRSRLVPATDLFFASNLVVFFVALSGSTPARWAGPAFYIWLTVFAIFSVSLFWSLMTDLYDRAEARRLFGVVAAGGSAGALAGPASISILARRLGPEPLLLIAATLLVICAATALRLRPRSARRREEDSAPIGGATLGGVGRTLRSPFLLTAGLVLVCYTMISTFLYFSQTEVVGAAIPDSGERTALFARIDLAVNSLALLLQIAVTGPLVRRFGAGIALALVTALVTVGVGLVGLVPALATVVGLQIAHRAGHFAFGRPAREMLFVPLDAETRYKAKNFLDTTIFRAGDAVSAWALTAVRAQGAGLAATAWLCVPIGILWTVASYVLGRKWEERRAGLSGGPEAREAT